MDAKLLTTCYMKTVVRSFGSFQCKQFAQNIAYMLHRFLEHHMEFML